jgi:hypothetical protein
VLLTAAQEGPGGFVFESAHQLEIQAEVRWLRWDAPNVSRSYCSVWLALRRRIHHGAKLKDVIS